MGTAAYLDVFGSIYAVMKELKKQGYTVEDIPDSVEGRAMGGTCQDQVMVCQHTE